MRVAVIDLGTNTFNLLIAEIKKNSSPEIILNSKIAVKLGEDGINKRIIQPPAIERGIKAIVHFSEEIKKLRVDKIYAFATSAVRNASNGKEFCERIAEATKIKINIIDGDREAELIYKGVQDAVELTEEKVLIMDIGGGSTEFIIADKHEIFWKQSFEIGAARLLDIFPHSEPILLSEINKINDYLKLKLQPLFEAFQRYQPRCLIGSSGSFDTFAELVAHRFYSPDILKNRNDFNFKLQEFELIYEQLINSTKAERLRMDGLIQMRVDMIVIAAICTSFVLRNLDLKAMKLSTYALKEGVLSELLNVLE